MVGRVAQGVFVRGDGAGDVAGAVQHLAEHQRGWSEPGIPVERVQQVDACGVGAAREVSGGGSADEQRRLARGRLQGFVEQPFGFGDAAGVERVPGALRHGLDALRLAGRRLGRQGREYQRNRHNVHGNDLTGGAREARHPLASTTCSQRRGREVRAGPGCLSSASPSSSRSRPR